MSTWHKDGILHFHWHVYGDGDEDDDDDDDINKNGARMPKFIDKREFDIRNLIANEIAEAPE